MPSGLRLKISGSVSFVYTGLLVRAFPHLHRLNLTYYSKSPTKSPTLLAFCFLFICVIDPTQICLSPISLELLELFQGIVCNNERLKEGKLEPWIIGGEIRMGPQTPLYTMTPLGAWPGLGTQPCYEAPCNLQIKYRQNNNGPKLAIGQPNSS